MPIAYTVVSAIPSGDNQVSLTVSATDGKTTLTRSGTVAAGEENIQTCATHMAVVLAEEFTAPPSAPDSAPPPPIDVSKIVITPDAVAAAAKAMEEGAAIAAEVARAEVAAQESTNTLTDTTTSWVVP